MKNAFDAHISRWDMAEKKNLSLRIYQYKPPKLKGKKRKKKNWEKGKRKLKNCGTVRKRVTFM